MGIAQELAESIVHRFLTLMRYRHHVSNQLRKTMGISGRQLAVLRYLAEHGPRSVGEISSHLYVRDASTSSLLDRLERDGYVARTRCQEDNRRVYVHLTEAGREILAGAPLTPIALMRARLPELAVDELEIIDKALARLSEIAQVDESVLE